MVIVDPQVHIWGADTPDRPWPPGRAHQAQKPYPWLDWGQTLTFSDRAARQAPKQRPDPGSQEVKV
jgi:hypothetical protein